MYTLQAAQCKKTASDTTCEKLKLYEGTFMEMLRCRAKDCGFRDLQRDRHRLLSDTEVCCKFNQVLKSKRSEDIFSRTFHMNP